MANAEAALAIIGASYLQLPLVRKARELGIRTVCFAWEEGAVCRDFADRYYPVSVTDREEILRLCRQENVGAVATIASDVAVPTVNHVAHAMGFPGNSIESAHLATNKFAMRRALADAGARVPDFALVRRVSEAGNAAARIGFPVIVKPCDRSGSLGVTLVDGPSGLADAVQTALAASFCGEAVVERFVAGAREISVEGISEQGKYHPLAVTFKETTGSPHFVEIGQHQGERLPPEIEKEVLRQVRLGLAALKIEYGASHPELMLAPDGAVYLTEIGARMGGDFIGSDLVRLSTGYDFLTGVIESAFGHFSGVRFGERRAAGVWFAAPETPEVCGFLRHGAAHPVVVRSEFRPEDLKPLARSADRAGYFIYQCGLDTPEYRRFRYLHRAEKGGRLP